MFLFVVAILIMSVVIHEVAHGYAALALGDPTAKYQDRLTLNPIKHLDPVGSVLVPLVGYFLGGFIVGWARPVPFNPYNLDPRRWGLPARFGEAIVAFAGPLSNIGIAVVFGFIIRSLEISSITPVLSFVVLINLTLAFFNLIPVPPLDGSKILFAFLPLKMESLRRNMEQYGFFLVFIFIAFFWQFFSPIVFKSFTLITGLAF